MAFSECPNFKKRLRIHEINIFSCFSAFIIVLVVLALALLMHRAHRAGLSLKGLKHSRLLTSPDVTMESSHVQTSPQSEASSVSLKPNPV